jgi:KDO2-lipid IV(A) lauroyltransferase
MQSSAAMSVKRVFYAVIGFVAAGLLKVVRLTDPDWLANFVGGFMRRVGPWLKEHEIGRANLAAAYPEKSAQEIEQILLGVWENLGRFASEFAHLDRFWDFDPARPGEGRMTGTEEAYRRALKLREEGKPALVFAAHIGNWEMGAVAGHQFGFDTTVLYRPPNIGGIADAAIEMRAALMGNLIPTRFDAPIRIAEALARGSHVGMLVDQYYTGGVDVMFFGRPARTNPLIARLARHYDCPIYGIYALRHPGNRFFVHLTDPITPVRNPDGQIDVQGTMQAITSEIESWIRRAPEQWLWLHRRWR